MERLTKKLEHFGGYSARLSKTIWQCIDRLGQYEDTGLTPEQIKEIDRLYSEKCREVEEYQKSALTGIELANIKIAIDKLREYQDLENRGLLLRVSEERADDGFRA